MKKLKVTQFILCMVILFLCINVPVKAEKTEKSLTDMSKEECLETLIQNRLIIPDEYSDYQHLEEFVKKVADGTIEDPGRISWFNYTHAQDFAMQIRKAVLEYEGIDENDLYKEGIVSFADDRNKLQYSVYLTPWSERFLNYNCYAYAINKAGLGHINPGEMIGVEYSQTTIASMTIDRIALLVTYDLAHFKYTNITYGKNLPNSESGYRIISIRKCTEDYHLMYMYSKGVWHHKPGAMSPLQYKYFSLTEGKWISEGLLREQYKNGNCEYNSEIIYI